MNQPTKRVRLLTDRELRKLPKNFFHSIEDISQHDRHWLSIDARMGLVERYLRGYLRLHIHVLRRPESHLSDLSFVFGHYHITNSAEANAISEIDVGTFVNVDEIPASGHVHCAKFRTAEGNDRLDSSNGDDANGTVFVSVIDLAEEDERIAKSISFVRLRLLNDIDVALGQTSKHGGTAFCKSGEIIGDRKAEIASPLLILHGQVADSVNQMLQSRSSVVREISDNHRALGWNGLSDTCRQHLLGALHVRLESNGIGLRIDKPLDETVESIQVVFCPIDLRAKFHRDSPL